MEPTRTGSTWGPGVPGPLSVPATVRAALRLYGADVRALWAAIALVIVPVQALVVVLSLVALPRGAELTRTVVTVPASSAGTYASISSLATLLPALALLLCTGAAYRILLGRHLHHPAGLRESFAFALERAPGLLWVSALVAAGVIVGLICFVLPGIYLFVALAVAVPVLMTEDRRGFRALGRSRALVSGHWFHALGCLLVATLLVAGGQALANALLGPLTHALSPRSIAGFLLIDAVLSAVISTLIAPFTAAVSTVLYVDLLLRQDDPYLGRLLA